MMFLLILFGFWLVEFFRVFLLFILWLFKVYFGEFSFDRVLEIELMLEILCGRYERCEFNVE